MPTLNINGNIRTNTTAGWTADATVYTAKTILITTDAYWGSTDQRKFKIADGTQTWAQLDYPPFKVADPTLAQVLTAGASTGNQEIVSADGDAGVYIANGMEVTTRAGASTASLTEGTFDITGADLLLTDETASRILSTDANKKVKILSTTTYPSLTELSYVKGVTSAIQTQINAKEATITTLPISKGGTNSGTALNNGCVMISSGGAIIEGDTATYPSTTELAYVKGVTSSIQTQLNANSNLLGSPFTITDVQTHTGTTSETVMPIACPNLVGIMLDNYLLNLAMGVQATNSGNNKTFRFYISDSQDALLNEVLIGSYVVTTAAVNTTLMEKLIAMTSISTQNIISGTTIGVATGSTMGTASIDFSSGTKYLVVTFQLATGTDTMKLQFAYSSINRKV